MTRAKVLATDKSMEPTSKRQKLEELPWLAQFYDESLAEINMKWTNVGKGGGDELAEALVANSSLRSLVVERCGLAYHGGRALGVALGKGTSLTYLDLSLNDIGPDGGRAFGDALRVNCTLTSLVMAKCGLGPEGGRAVAQALESNTTLLTLNLDGNDVGMDGGRAFGAALAANVRANVSMSSNSAPHAFALTPRSPCASIAGDTHRLEHALELHRLRFRGSQGLCGRLA